METVGKNTTLGVETQVTTTQKYDTRFSFAYQVGAGIEVAKNLVVGVSFYDLGQAKVQGERTVKTKTLNDNVTNTNTSFEEYGQVHPVMIMGRIGFSF